MLARQAIQRGIWRRRWTPARLGSSLLACWDAERSDLITQSGGAVSSWKDTVGAYDLAQAVSASKPTLSASSFNARPGLTFDGVDDYGSLESVPLPVGSDPCEIWALVDQTALAADATARRLISYGGTSINNSRGLGRTVNGGVNRAAVNVGTGAANVTVRNDNVDLSGRHVLRAVFTATTARVDVDGVAGTPAAAVPATTSTRTVLGARTSLTVEFWQGVVSLVAVTGALSTDQATAFLAYINARKG